MITLRAELAANLDQPRSLHEALQIAIELEHATIPAYLYALYSIEPGTNVQIVAAIKSVVLEEMTHMGLACNLLNAVGGAPLIAKPEFVPRYPGKLPGSVESGLEVGLAPLTLELVEQVFMAIEQPEEPIRFRVREFGVADRITIGEFYAAIADQLKASGGSAFTGDPGRQVTHELGQEGLIAITDLDSALNAITTIVEEGEGTQKSPLDQEGELAHYYRFAEITHGRSLVLNPDVPPDAPPEDHYSYSGAPIPFDPSGVRDLVVNPRLTPYPADSAAAAANRNFNYTYTALLKSLHSTFNGEPRQMLAAVGLMESAKQIALEMGEIPANSESADGLFAGPTFEWQPLNLPPDST